MIEKEFVQEAAFHFFERVHKRFLLSKGHFREVIGDLASAYELLEYDVEKMEAATNLSEKVKAAHPLATNFARHFYDTLDYFMYNKGSVQVQEVLNMPTEAELREKIALPSDVFPSDHLRI